MASWLVNSGHDIVQVLDQWFLRGRWWDLNESESPCF